MFNILIVDDNDELREHLGRLYEEEGYGVVKAATGEEAKERLHEQKFAIVVSDVQMPQMDGIELTRHIRDRYSDTDIILITGFGNVQQAVDAMKLGASDYISKPFQPEVIRFVSEKLIEKRRLREEIVELRQRLSEGYSLGKMIGRSGRMAKVFEMIKALADTDSGVMIIGETGTGKELAARAIHDLSARKDRPFVAINCGAFPETLLEGELFGYDKGAFTGAVQSRQGKIELANGGTLFLDEVENITAAMQVKLLRVLQEREVERLGSNRKVKVDMRIIAASNVDLSVSLAKGSLREDFYYRINVVPLELPPLRDRLEDLPLLIDHLLSRNPLARQRKIQKVSNSALGQMLDYHWPGNIRELENILERAIIRCGTDVVDEVDLPRAPNRVMRSIVQNAGRDMTLTGWLASKERDYLEGLLSKHKGSINAVAKEADVDTKTLYRKMKKQGLTKESFKDDP
ncbi:MAG: sigma-54 dependent transcriptional regulator [Deltaproteobacteria bacterium]|nr:sigma-54 dependent transcriptional regulator [Deltaproteobacteria bacterium]